MHVQRDADHAGTLNKLLIEQTKSRPRHSNDNGLVESKNGAVIRKHIVLDHIASGCAEPINVFYREHFNPYLNLHRPSGVPELTKDSKGKTNAPTRGTQPRGRYFGRYLE